MARPARSSAYFLLAVACACHGVPSIERSGPRAPTPEDFPAANTILAGFDPVEPGGAWRAGDELLFGIRLVNGGLRRHWLLHLRLTEPRAIARKDEAQVDGGFVAPATWSIAVDGRAQQHGSDHCRALATVYDADGAVLGRSEPLLLRGFLAAGFTAACETVAAHRAANGPFADSAAFYRGIDAQPFAIATIAAIALLQVVQDDRVLARILWEVVQKPSAWSVLTNLGARVKIAPHFHLATPVTAANGSHGPAFDVPLGLFVNDQPALEAVLTVVPSAVPFALAGGVVAATARHPRDASVEMAMVLLAARRGPMGPAPR